MEIQPNEVLVLSLDIGNTQIKYWQGCPISRSGSLWYWVGDNPALQPVTLRIFMLNLLNSLVTFLPLGVIVNLLVLYHVILMKTYYYN